MSSVVRMSEDMILEIMSHCSDTDIEKFCLQKKSLYKYSQEMYFIHRHLHRTNCVLGFFIQYLSRFVSIFEEGAPDDISGISLEFLPSRDVYIEACDTHHGILLCVEGRLTQHYIVCKPATKQYQIIPKPKPWFITIASGLMVIQSNPFRYKIVRVSEPREPRRENENFFNLDCEVYDSGSFAWKQLNDLELSKDESLARPRQPISSWGFMHWLTSKKKLIRFCMRTETWSFLPVPREVEDNDSLDLISYEGKLSLICSSSEQTYYSLWVLEQSKGKSWVHVKDVEIQGLYANNTKPMWFPSNDVVLMDCSSRYAVYNMKNNKYRYILPKTDKDNRSPFYLPRDYCFPFYSNHETVRL